MELYVYKKNRIKKNAKIKSFKSLKLVTWNKNQSSLSECGCAGFHSLKYTLCYTSFRWWCGWRRADGGVGGGEIKTHYTQLCTIFVSRQLKRTRGLKTDYHNVTNPNFFILIFYLIFNFFDIYFRHTFSIYYIGDLAPQQNKPHRIKWRYYFEGIECLKNR